MAKSKKRRSSSGPRRPVGRRHPTTIPSAVLLALLLLTAAASASIRLPGGGKGSGGGGGVFPLPWGIRAGLDRARGGAAGSSTIPRSTSSAHRSSISDPSPSSTSGSSAAPQSHSHPPWNPSAQIDDDGFLRTTYTLLPGEWEPEAAIGGKHGAPSGRYYRTLHRVPVTVRQVPGDGNCLFHSIATCLAHAVNGTHICMRDTSILRSHSALLRTAAVDCLSRSPNRRLFLQGSEYLRAGELVTAAAAQYDLTGEEYCDQMRRDSYWGGGPEIVALCNVLRRPIHVYELCSDAVVPTDLEDEEVDDDNEGGGGRLIRGGGKSSTTPTQFRLRRMACFGSPRYDRREPLHILSADSRFPDIQPGRQLSTGNHFLALFPDPKEAVRRGGGSPRRVRGGGASSSSSSSSSSASSVRRRNGVDNDDGKRRSATTGSRKKKKVRPTSSDDEIQDREGSSIWGKVADRVGRILDWE